MATVTLPQKTAKSVGGCAALHNVSRKFYEQFLEEFDERRVLHSYVNGELRIMSPSPRHENSKKLIAQLVETLTDELDLPRYSLGSMTMKLGKHEKGAEPDECYLITAAPQITDIRNYDLDIDPPPDLVVEVDVTSPSLNRLPVYAALGIPEVWIYDGKTLTIALRQDDGSYQSSESSRSFPKLSANDLTVWLENAYQTDETAWIRRFRQWVQENVKTSGNR